MFSEAHSLKEKYTYKNLGRKGIGRSRIKIRLFVNIIIAVFLLHRDDMAKQRTCFAASVASCPLLNRWINWLPNMKKKALHMLERLDHYSQWRRKLWRCQWRNVPSTDVSSFILNQVSIRRWKNSKVTFITRAEWSPYSGEEISLKLSRSPIYNNH